MTCPGLHSWKLQTGLLDSKISVPCRMLGDLDCQFECPQIPVET